uniref:Uncharacterized protein n=1 Tax=Ascaris lumbricoides TaxID=6252 RepID=A0A0M3IUR1_ASCLU
MAAGIQMPRPFMVSYHYRIVIHDTHPGVTSRINLAHFRRQMDCTLEQKPLLNAIGRVVDSIGNTNDEASVCLSDTMINVLIATNMRSVGIARDWRHGSWYPNATPIYGVVSLPYRHP